MMNLMDGAAAAKWVTGTLDRDGHSVVGPQTISFGGSDGDAKGFARRDTLTCEDGQKRDVLRTHPRWAANGTIKGFLPWSVLPTGAMFSAKVGFVAGASGSDGVRFQVWVHYQVAGKEEWVRVVDFDKKVTGHLVEIRADLTWLAGKSCGIELRVDAGKSSQADWALWFEPRIEQRELTAATGFRFRADQLIVNHHDSSELSGDDPALALIYFRTTLGHRGSTRVIVRSKLKELGTDKGNHALINVTASADLAVDDVFPAWPAGDLVLGDGAAIAGLQIVAIERDSAGDGVVQAKVLAAAQKLKTSLQARLEPLLLNEVLFDPQKLGDALALVKTDVAPPPSGAPKEVPPLVGLGLLTGSAFEKLVGHDLVGTNSLTVFGLAQDAFDLVLGLINNPPSGAKPKLTIAPNAVQDPIAPAMPRRFSLVVSGSGSLWQILIALDALPDLVALPTGI